MAGSKMLRGLKARGRGLEMAKGACVHSWSEDSAAVGAQVLVPVTCRDVIDSLKGLVAALDRGTVLSAEQVTLLGWCLTEEPLSGQSTNPPIRSRSPGNLQEEVQG